MAANYVKFRRGTPEQFAGLQHKADDTLYFIFSEDESQAKLYLGEKLVACGQTNGATDLAGLTDVALSGLANRDCLVYSEGKWVNKSVKSCIDAMVGATESSAGVSGLVPAPEAGEANRYLRADGKWVAMEPEVTQIENSANVEHSELMPAGASIGDILIIKDVITDGKYQHTAYVYAEEGWAAMDGNYSADNVYFNSDLIYTAKIGVMDVPSSGSGTIAAKGKNVKELFASILAKESNPSVSQPSVSIRLNEAKAYEVGTKVTPTYNVTFNAGSYQYGPATGVTATHTVTDTRSNSAEGTAGSFAELTVVDGINYKVSVSSAHTAGAVPKSNLGNEVASLAIKEGTKAASSQAITGYRNSFYGTAETAIELTSANIRDLTKSGGAKAAGQTINVSVPVGAKRVIFAYPATLRDVNSVLDVNGLNAEIKTAFKMTKVEIEGANGYDSIEYKVYYTDFANPNDAANTYKVTI